MSPFTLFPLGLVVVHLGPFRVPPGVVQGVLETPSPTLLQAEEDEPSESDGYHSCNSTGDADLRATWELVPFLGERFRGSLVELLHGGRVAPYLVSMRTKR